MKNFNSLKIIINSVERCRGSVEYEIHIHVSDYNCTTFGTISGIYYILSLYNYLFFLILFCLFDFRFHLLIKEGKKITHDYDNWTR